MTIYAPPGSASSLVTVEDRYGHFIGGNWVDPKKGLWFENLSPVNGKPFTAIARGTEEDIEAALDAAHSAAPAWGRTPAAERSLILGRVADRLEENLEALAVAESWENGKAVRETQPKCCSSMVIKRCSPKAVSAMAPPCPWPCSS